MKIEDDAKRTPPSFKKVALHAVTSKLKVPAHCKHFTKNTNRFHDIFLIAYEMTRGTIHVTLVLINALVASNGVTAFLSPSIPSSFLLTFSRNHQNRPQHAKGISPIYMSSIGDGNNNNDGGDSDGNLDDFLDPKKALEESENLKKARAALSEDALPINFDDQKSESAQEDNTDTELDPVDDEGEEPGFLAPANVTALLNNPYLSVVSKLSPSDLISKFTSTAHPRVQDAVRSTILGLIGTLPKMAFETTTITTGEKLASLMFQLQMTGYMFKNAEYRLSLSQSLGMDRDINRVGKFLLEQADVALDDEDDEDERLSAGKVKGKIKVRYETKTSSTRSKASGYDDKDADDEEKDDGSDSEFPAMEVEVDAEAYMAELRNEVSKLRDDLTSTRQAKDESVRKDLLLYIRTLPKQELNTLTNTMSDDVLGAMKGLVNVVMGGIGEGQIDRNTVTEQSGEAMAQLCMWQLVVGYNLRELEVREEMKNTLISGSSVAASEVDEDADSSIDYGGGGFE